MSQKRTYSLESIRTDGWFEQMSEQIGSFQSLCEIVGEPFVAFSLIAGIKITGLVVDRRNLDLSIVDFLVLSDENQIEKQYAYRLQLNSFREQLVTILFSDQPETRIEIDPEDQTSLQRHIGVRYLLLSSIYGFELSELVVQDSVSSVRFTFEGNLLELTLEMFQAKIEQIVREELENVSYTEQPSIDLMKVAESETAIQNGEYEKVIQLLGTWPGPLSIFLRTSEAQSLSSDTRSLIAKGLGILGTSTIQLGEQKQGEDIFRLAIQYAPDSVVSADIFHRLGEAILLNDRPGEAIGFLRRALQLGAVPKFIWPLLCKAFIKRKKFVAALGCLREAKLAGSSDQELFEDRLALDEQFGDQILQWEGMIGNRTTLVN